MTEPKPPLDTWAIIDLFGHQQIAGHVTEQAIGGESLLRVDVPDAPGRAAFTRFYGVKAIYSLTPVSEELARSAVEHLRERAITVYGLALPAGPTQPNREQPDREFAETGDPDPYGVQDDWDEDEEEEEDDDDELSF